MISLETIDRDLTESMKARDAARVQVLRALKTRVQNEKVAKIRDLSEEEIVALVRSEVKRRKEAAEAFGNGGRPDQASQELAEAAILEQYLPEQLSEAQIATIIDEVISAGSFVAADFGKVMGRVKARVGSSADGSVVARILKEKLK